MVYLLSDFVGSNATATSIIFIGEFLLLTVYGIWLVSRTRSRDRKADEHTMPYLIIDNT